MAGVKLPKVKSPAQMKAEMAVGRARAPQEPVLSTAGKNALRLGDVLPKAERDANQAKFLEQSADSRRFYHGSKKPDITEFKTRKDLTDESMMTGHYADERDAVFLSPNPDFTNNFSMMGYTDAGEAPTTYPVYAQIKNPFDFDNPEHLQRVKDTYKDMYHNPESELYDPSLLSSERSMDLIKFNKAVDSLQGDENNWGRIENQKFQDVLKDIGYDSFYTRERGTKNLGVYDPNQIKSAIGNRGTYDTSDPDITKAHGGAVKMGKGGLPPVKAPKVSAPKVESPTVMKRSDVSDLFRLINEREGSYGAKRVERAADEIPNLEKLYTLDALRSAFSGDNARALMTLKPSEFEKYAAPLLTNLSQQSNDNIANLKAIQNVGGFSDVPFFLVNKELAGSTGLPWITGHEGRHRNRAMDEAGVQAGLVQFLPRAELREPFPRKSQEQYIDAIRKEMALSGNKVKPEKYYLNETDEKSFQRPTIDLPDLYADGGAVKMKDGGDPDQEFYDRMREEFSVYNKPTYGNEIPGTPTIDQQRYELTMKGRQEAENRARTTRDNLTAMDPSGTLGIVDALKTVGKAVVAPIAYVGGNAFDWLQTGKVDPAKSKARGERLESWMTPKTQEGGELLEEIGKVGPAITGSEMGFGMHPNLWASGIGLTTPKQTAAGLRLGSERVTPFAKDVGSMASELYMSGRMPGMVAPNMFAVSPDGKPSKVLAPANEIGFYSPTEAAALNLQRKSGQGQAFLNDIMKGENVRADEISAMGLDTFLKGKTNVTADEVRDYIAQNKIQLGEEIYQDKPNFVTFLKNKGLSPEDAESMYYKAENRDLVADEYLNEYTSIKKPKFSNYALPGGENYREIVLTLPQSPEHVEFARLNKKMNDDDGLLPDDMQRWTELGSKLGEEGRRQAKEGRYQSSHWDEPNPLSHLRVSDRVTDGKKTLLVDEVQSDWHQAGREQGYKTSESDVAKKAYQDYAGDLEKRYVEKIREEANSIYLASDPIDMENFVRNTVNQKGLKDMARALGEEDKYNSLYRDYNLEKGQNRQGVPDAPYKDDWYQLTLRRAIKEAVDGGYDRVALPTGARVADRFDLSKQIDRLDYNINDDGTYSLSGIKDGREVVAKEGLTEKELANNVGKEVAEKMIKGEGKNPTEAVDRWDPEDGDDMPLVKSLSGLDLSVGGEGMKKYYDEIYPNYLKKFGKKYGANVGMTSVQIEPPTDKIFRDLGKFHAYTGQGRETKKFNTYAEALEFLGLGKEPLHYMEITPAMRKEFSTGIHMKRGGKVQFAKSLDAMRHELTKAK